MTKSNFNPALLFFTLLFLPNLSRANDGSANSYHSQSFLAKIAANLTISSVVAVGVLHMVQSKKNKTIVKDSKDILTKHSELIEKTTENIYQAVWQEVEKTYSENKQEKPLQNFIATRPAFQDQLFTTFSPAELRVLAHQWVYPYKKDESMSGKPFLFMGDPYEPQTFNLDRTKTQLALKRADYLSGWLVDSEHLKNFIKKCLLDTEKNSLKRIGNFDRNTTYFLVESESLSENQIESNTLNVCAFEPSAIKDLQPMYSDIQALQEYQKLRNSKNWLNRYKAFWFNPFWEK